MSDVITLAHGSGGRKTSELIAELFKKNLGNEYYKALQHEFQALHMGACLAL